jgi:hypothetical protein
MNVSSHLGLSHLRKFDVRDSQKMPISQKLAMIDPVRMAARERAGVFGR